MFSKQATHVAQAASARQAVSCVQHMFLMQVVHASSPACIAHGSPPPAPLPPGPAPPWAPTPAVLLAAVELVMPPAPAEVLLVGLPVVVVGPAAAVVSSLSQAKKSVTTASVVDAIPRVIALI
jgi:hypothetical protein